MLNLRLLVGMLSAGLVVLGAGGVSGQTYPSKPIRIAASTIGGGTDFVARLVAQGLSALGQPVIVDNRGAVMSGELVSKALPDGYTLLVGSDASWIVSLLQNVPYDPVRDFSPISLTARAPNVLVVHPSAPIKSVKDLIALAKAKPGELNYGSAGTGSTPHLAGELFKSMAGVKIVGVSYRGGGPTLIALLGGYVQLFFGSASSVAPHVTSGRLRALAVTSAQPSALAPGLPTMAASGVPGYEVTSSYGLLAPAGTPAMIINLLHQEIVRFLNTATVKERFFSTGSETVGSSPEEFAATLKFELAKWGKLIKEVGIKSN